MIKDTNRGKQDKILVILGPTATGKTDLALILAHKFSGEIVSADSRQVYKGLDIGTGKRAGGGLSHIIFDSYWKIDGIPVFLYDVVSPKQQFSVKDYFQEAMSKVKNILHRENLPIIVGGTGLYIRALIYGLPNLQIPLNVKLREELVKLTLLELQEKLYSLSVSRWELLNKADRQNKRRLLRSIEIELMNPYIDTKFPIKGLSSNFNILKIGLTASRPFLREKINQRLLDRISQGLIAEGERLHKEGISYQKLRELGLEYRYLADHLEGLISREEFADILKIKIWQYAKRQLTWFKKEEGVFWFDVSSHDWEKEVEKLVKSWYDNLA